MSSAVFSVSPPAASVLLPDPELVAVL